MRGDELLHELDAVAILQNVNNDTCIAQTFFRAGERAVLANDHASDLVSKMAPLHMGQGDNVV